MSTRIWLPSPDFPNYIRALEAFGAEPCFSDPGGCCGLLLPGGGDIDPARYGEENRGSKGIDTARDALEFAALDAALRAGIPVLGVCRGCQLINVAFGGTLRQDIPGHRDEGDDELQHPSHTTDPMLIELYGGDFTVNSTHHQAVRRPGEGLRCVQWAPDGVVEAIRHESLPIFAVQWHPERLYAPTEGWKLIGRWLEELK